MVSEKEVLTFEIGVDESVTVRSWAELNKWVKKEQDRWGWLQPADPATDAFNWAAHVHNQWVQIAQQLMQYSVSGNALPTALPILAPLASSGTILASESREGDLVTTIRQNAGGGAAAFAYAFLKRHVNMSQATTRDWLLGAMMTALPEYGSAAELAQQLQRERANQRNQFRELSRMISQSDADRAEEQRSYFKRAIDTASGIVRRRRDSWAETQGTWAENAEAAVQSIRDVENTFSEKMRLKAPVEYWRRKADEHHLKEQDAQRTLKLFFPLVTLALLGAFAVAGNVIIGTASTKSGHPPAAIYVLVTGALAFMTTIAFWVGRLFTKLYLSEHHLANDANERAIMTETYLALTNAQAASEQDRQIILTALFRTTTDGIVKDDGPSDLNLGALISRALSKP